MWTAMAMPRRCLPLARGWYVATMRSFILVVALLLEPAAVPLLLAAANGGAH